MVIMEGYFIVNFDNLKGSLCIINPWILAIFILCMYLFVYNEETTRF